MTLAKADIGVSANVHLLCSNVLTGERWYLGIKNTWVDGGLDFILDFFGQGGPVPDQVAVGTGISPTTAGMTALEAEVLAKTVNRRVPVKTPTKKLQWRVLLETGDANGNTLSEIGLKYKTTLLARGVADTPLVKTPAIQATAIYETTFTAL